MAIKTQGTELYVIDPADGSVIQVGCPTSIDGIDTSIPQIDITCLDSSAREYVAGMPEPGAATFGINVDPSDPSHTRLHQLKLQGVTLQWAVGWSDGFGIPPTSTVNSAGDYEFVAPTGRSWILFEGYMSSYPFNFTSNAVVTSTVGIQVSGEPEFIPATI